MRAVKAFPGVPESREEIHKIFGNLPQFIRRDGTLDPSFEEKHIVRIDLPGPVAYAYDPKIKITKLTVNRALRHVARALFAEVWEQGLVAALGPYGGGFVFRPVRGRESISTHSYGLAWDWDPAGFPLGSSKKRDPRLVAVFEEFGFLCGQNFKGRKDPMHFQFAVNV